ncbi:MAG: hypothetical protein J7K62_00095 [Thermoplasmata archaeon]|nr:hypothetical protein [Thermoplasmata archaeon]
MSIMTIGVVAGMMGVGTFAVFNDTETAIGTFTAGTLNIQVGGTDPCTEHITFDDIAPGDYLDSLFVVENTGSLDGNLYVEIKNVKNYENGRTEPEQEAGDTGNPGELGEYLQLTNMAVGIGGTWTSLNSQLGWPRPSVNDADASNLTVLVVFLRAGETAKVGMDWKLPEDTSNIVQNDIVEFDIVFRLDQV